MAYIVMAYIVMTYIAMTCKLWPTQLWPIRYGLQKWRPAEVMACISYEVHKLWPAQVEPCKSHGPQNYDLLGSAEPHALRIKDLLALARCCRCAGAIEQVVAACDIVAPTNKTFESGRAL